MLLLLACVSVLPPSGPRPLRVALDGAPDAEVGGYYAAVVGGAYTHEGLAVTLVPGQGDALDRLAAGEAEVAIVDVAELLVRRAHGLDAVAVYAGLQDGSAGLLVHDPGPTTLDEVRGPVAATRGSAFERFLWARLGWGDAVPLVAGDLAAFAADPSLALEGRVTVEPCAAEALGLHVRFLPARAVGWDPYGAVAVVRREDEDAAWVAPFVRGSLAGWEAWLVDPEPTFPALMKDNAALTPAGLRCAAARERSFVNGGGGLGVVTQSRLDQVAASLARAGEDANAQGARGAGAVNPRP